LVLITADAAEPGGHTAPANASLYIYAQIVRACMLANSVDTLTLVINNVVENDLFYQSA
jgi:hypothetical protein